MYICWKPLKTIKYKLFKEAGHLLEHFNAGEYLVIAFCSQHAYFISLTRGTLFHPLRCCGNPHSLAYQAIATTDITSINYHTILWGARWLSGRVSDSGARGPGFETYRRRVVSLSKTLYSPKVLVNYPGSDGSVPTWLKNCWLGR